MALQDYDVLITPTLPYLATSHCEPDATPLQQIAKQVGLVSNSECLHFSYIAELS
jgi:amidase